MRKLLLAIGVALIVILTADLAQAQLANPGCTAISCMQAQANVTNPITNTNTTTTATSTTTDVTNKINAALKGSVLNAGTLSQTTTNTWTSATTNAAGGAGSSLNTASLTGNTINQTPTQGNVGGAVSMAYSLGGQGIIYANQNTGANAVQQNSVALTSVVGGNGGGLSGFSPAITAPVR